LRSVPKINKAYFVENSPSSVGSQKILMAELFSFFFFQKLFYGKFCHMDIIKDFYPHVKQSFIWQIGKETWLTNSMVKKMNTVN